MIRYIAFLRGINVGGHRIIKMEELKKMFEGMKFKNVMTYIQSGNVIFDSTMKSKSWLTSNIEKQIKVDFGFEVIVIIRTFSELEKAIQQNPFKKIKLDKATHQYLSFLGEEPDKHLLKTFIAKTNSISTYKIINNEIYILYNRDKAKDPFSNISIEKQLKVSATTRKWNVINKIYVLANRLNN